MKAWEVIAWVGEHEFFCPDCRDDDDGDFTPVFACSPGDLANDEVCGDCGCVWSVEDFNWQLPYDDATGELGHALRR